MALFKTRVVCPNIGHAALTASFAKKSKFLQVKNSFATIVNELSILILFRLLNGDLLFSQYASTKCVNLELRSYGRMFEIRAHTTLITVGP